MTPILNTGSGSSIYLTIEEMRRLISSVKDTRDRFIFRILYETGCTPAELVNIKVSDVAGNMIRIKDGGTGNFRLAKISGVLAKSISLYVAGNCLGRESYLLSTRQSEKISEKRVRQLIQRHTKGFVGKLNPLSLRYMHIAHAYLNGVFLEDISKQVGVSTFRIFQILQDLRLKPGNNHYNNFLKRVGQ